MCGGLGDVLDYLGNQFTDPITTSENPFDLSNWQTEAQDAFNTDPGNLVRNILGNGAADTLHSVVDSVAPIVASFTPLGPLGGAALSAGINYGNTGNIGSSLLSALPSALSYGFDASGIGSALGSGLSDLGDGIGGAASDLGGGISDDLSNFADWSGLSDFLGGTATPTDALNNSYQGISNAGIASGDVANAASTIPSANAGFIPSGVAANAGGGGIGGGFDPGNVGEDLNLGSSSGVGAASNNIGSNVGTFGLDNTAPIGGADISGSGIAPNLATASDPNIGSGISTAPSTISNIFNPSNNAGTFTSDAFGNAGGASANSVADQFSLPSIGSPSVATAGNTANNGLLGQLFGGSSNNNSMINGLVKNGLGYLLNNNNTAGYKAQENAGQNIAQDYQPFLTAGTAANNQLSSLYGLNGSGAQSGAQTDWQNTPGYQFALQQGLNSVNADAAAKGQTLSGNNQQAIQQYGTGLANQTYNNYLQNLQQQAGLGAQAAGGVASGQAGTANAQFGLGNTQASNQNSAMAGGLQSLFPSGGINLSSLFGGNNNASNLPTGGSLGNLLSSIFGSGS